jgi:hypothetical protein
MNRKVWSNAMGSLTVFLFACTLAAQPASSNRQSIRDNHGFKEFHERVEAYKKVHRTAEKSVPKLKKKSTQEVVAARQLALLNKIRELRGDAKRGDIFTPNATQAIAQVIKAVYSGPDAQPVRNTIKAGEPLSGFQVQINQQYPDGLSFTTLPPTLLLKLPEVPDEVAYRILGSTLLLVDSQANLIVDFMPNAIP